jgi:hypothetical protein
VRKDVQFVTMVDCFDVSNPSVAFPPVLEFRKACQKITQKLLGLLSKQPIMSINVLRSQSRGRPLCFRRVLAGLRPLTFMAALQEMKEVVELS